MSISSDIPNLFGTFFDGETEHYLEISQQNDAYEARIRWPVLTEVELNTRALADEKKISNCGDHSLNKVLPVQQQPKPNSIRVITLISPKGGVGKTTLAANLAVALQTLGHSVLAIDFDPQNALCHHFQAISKSQLDSRTGIFTQESDWNTLSICTNTGVVVLPYGVLTGQQRSAFEVSLEGNPQWLAHKLRDLGLADGTLVILDTPTGVSPYLCQALSVANIALVVTLADAASYRALPLITHQIESCASNRNDFSMRYVINQQENAQQLNKDIAKVLRRNLGEQVLGSIHRDQSMAEALAHSRSILEQDPHTRGSHEILQCAQALIRQLAVQQDRQLA